MSDLCSCGCGQTDRSVQDIPWDGEWPVESCTSRIQKDQRCQYKHRYNQVFKDGKDGNGLDELFQHGVKDLQTLIAALREFKFKSIWIQAITTMKGGRPEWTVDLDYHEDEGITFTVTEVPATDYYSDEMDDIFYPPVYLDLTTSQFEVNGCISKKIPEQLSFLPFRPEISPFVKAARS